MATNMRHTEAISRIPMADQLRIGIVVAEWNGDITQNLFQGALDTLLALGVSVDRIQRSNVSGSFELIYGCRSMLNNHLDAVIAIGSVIRGETSHFDFVCQAVSYGIAELNLKGETPVIFCVLTDDTLEQAQSRSGGKLGNKGSEAAVAAVRMALLKKENLG
ncbi:MAG: 6,7-dimethyl-8-ribityllumazine synthase [Flavobacteriaceae bacterium]